ncbi:MAG TPA: guanylate kinase, partial [Rhabdaerophilum sp.]|nr:guanylate kinase [Rhabdaerophilum sp.]
MEKNRRGMMFVISSPSGAGKSVLSRLLLQADPSIRLSVSVTTRQRRPSEVDGVHYHFADVHTFETMRERGDLLEWAEVHGNFYATPRGPVELALAEGADVLFDIDVQGTLQLYQRMRPDVVSVFILPPSIEELQRRLKRRAEDADSVIFRRLQTAET